MRAIGIAALVAAACAHNVPQDDHTGEDGKVKGAREIHLENGEAKVHGIVTYPGGDRVDWKFVELDKDKIGQLDFDLQWRTPRPGLKLNFDVFDQWNNPQATGKRAGKRARTASITDAKGKYFIRVYAVGRGDAGEYRLAVDFKEKDTPISVNLAALPVQDPPKLAAVPNDIPCDESKGDTFDPKNPNCASVCPINAQAPPKWAPCEKECKVNDPANPACLDKFCPNPPTVRSKACMADKRIFPPCNAAAPDPENWNCIKPKDPILTRAIGVEVNGGDTNVTISVGTDNGVDRTWKGQILRGESNDPIPGGNIILIRVGKHQTVAKVHLPTDIVQQNLRIKLMP